MARTFQAQFYKRTSGKEADGTVTFLYPASEADDVDKIAKMVMTPLLVTVMTQDEAKKLGPGDANELGDKAGIVGDANT